jgi:hypothetical protein
MKNPYRSAALAISAMLFAAATHAAPPLPGAVFTTNQNGSLVNGNTTFTAKCGDTGVYLDGGPGVNAPARAAGLPDGDYYFQVTDASGKLLLSTDPVRDRCISVADGLVIGNCPTGTHQTFTDQDWGSVGARTVELCAAGVPFLTTPHADGVYKLWVTPAADGTLQGGGFVGDSSNVDENCAGGSIPGCFHGFLASRSKTDNFKVSSADVPVTTYCIRVEKRMLESGVEVPQAGWTVFVTDALGLTNSFQTGDQGSTVDQICGLTAGSYAVSEDMPSGYHQVRVELNGQPVDSSSVIVTLGSGRVAGDQTVVFVNESGGAA